MNTPLTGIRIVEFECIGPGPLAARIHRAARVNPVLDGTALGLTRKAISHRLHGMGLERLLFKLELHRF